MQEMVRGPIASVEGRRAAEIAFESGQLLAVEADGEDGRRIQRVHVFAVDQHLVIEMVPGGHAGAST